MYLRRNQHQRDSVVATARGPVAKLRKVAERANQHQHEERL